MRGRLTSLYRRRQMPKIRLGRQKNNNRCELRTRYIHRSWRCSFSNFRNNNNKPGTCGREVYKHTHTKQQQQHTRVFCRRWNFLPAGIGTLTECPNLHSGPQRGVIRRTTETESEQQLGSVKPPIVRQKDIWNQSRGG